MPMKISKAMELIEDELAVQVAAANTDEEIVDLEEKFAGYLVHLQNLRMQRRYEKLDAALKDAVRPGVQKLIRILEGLE